MSFALSENGWEEQTARILNGQTILSMYGIYYIKAETFIPKKTKGFALGSIMKNKRMYPSPGRFCSFINDSEIIIILGLMYPSYTTNCCNTQTIRSCIYMGNHILYGVCNRILCCKMVQVRQDNFTQTKKI